MKVLEEISLTWLVTGAAGFIGSHLVETLLKNNQRVVGLDNFITGKRSNLDLVKESVGEKSWGNFSLLEGDIRVLKDCKKSMIWRAALDDDLPSSTVDIVLHQAALGSVPRSFVEPSESASINIGGFINVLEAMKEASINNLVYASSSAVYGDSEQLPKTEGVTGRLLSPYAVTKKANESYARVYSQAFGLNCVGLRYFNVFGPRQDPDGAYAAVIPKWFSKLLRDETIEIYGDGETSRDFCYVSNVVEANVKAALSSRMKEKAGECGQSKELNIALGDRATLNELLEGLKASIAPHKEIKSEVRYCDVRTGDVTHSLADISLARSEIQYDPQVKMTNGISLLSKYYFQGN